MFMFLCDLNSLRKFEEYFVLNVRDSHQAVSKLCYFSIKILWLYFTLAFWLLGDCKFSSSTNRKCFLIVRRKMLS